MLWDRYCCRYNCDYWKLLGSPEGREKLIAFFSELEEKLPSRLGGTAMGVYLQRKIVQTNA